MTTLPLTDAGCPDLDRLVDDAVAGLPGASERLEAHTAACAACTAEALLADEPADLVDVLDCLRGTPAPLAVVEAALAEARRGRLVRSAVPFGVRAADRAPERGSRRRVWTVVAATAAALAVALVVLTQVRTPSPLPEAPLVAAQTPASTPPAVDGEPAPEAWIETPTSQPEVAAPVATPAPRRAPSARPARRAAPAPGQVPQVSPAPEVHPLAPTPHELVAEAPTPADTAAARADLMLALSIVGRAQQAADDAVANEMRRVNEALAPARIL